MTTQYSERWAVGTDTSDDDGWGLIEIITDDPMYTVVAEVLGDYDVGNGVDELTPAVRARAAMIAAAPDLFALVRAYSTTYPHDEFEDAARAALAKAGIGGAA